MFRLRDKPFLEEEGMSPIQESQYLNLNMLKKKRSLKREMKAVSRSRHRTGRTGSPTLIHGSDWV
jgi:hypothetical protein